MRVGNNGTTEEDNFDPDEVEQEEEEIEETESEEYEQEQESEEETETIVSEEEAVDPPPANAPLPPVALPDILSAAEVQALRDEGLSDQAIAILTGAAVRATQRSESSMFAATSVYQQTVQGMPEYAKVLGPRIQQHLSSVNHEMRGKQEGMNYAMAATILEEANADGTPNGFRKAIQRHAGLMNPQRQGNNAPATPTPKKPTQTPEQRVPSPTVSRGQQSQNSNSYMSRAQRLLGTTRAAIEDIDD